MLNNGYKSFNGKDIWSIKNIFYELTNTFTIEFWIKPELQNKLSLQSVLGVSGVKGQRFVIGPANPGNKNFAGVGVSVGVNGVSVYEHSENYLPALLVYPTNIKGWTHIAIVYENKTPYLYINGAFKKKGFTSTKQKVFPSGVFGGLKPYGYFKGQISNVRYWDHARSRKQIKKYYYRHLKGNEEGLFYSWKLNDNSESNKSTKEQPIDTPLISKSHRFNGNENVNRINGTNSQGASVLKDLEVDIVIPIFNGFSFVKRCIQSILDHSETTYNLYLINDASTDRKVVEFLEKLNSNNLPKNLKKLVIKHNSNNLGFVKSINIALKMTINHVILLNSDTIVPENWIHRIINPIIQNDNIASVTPFTNNGSICSFPKFNQSNKIPNGLNLEEINRIFLMYGSNIPIEIPTGVGFCMALNQKALKHVGVMDDKIFGHGYGEENDWCIRARNHGFKNVLIPNLFVYHEQGVSFDQLSKKREQRIEENLKKLKLKHPNYFSIIHKFIDEDPIKEVRNILISAVNAHSKQKYQSILYINHSIGGGTKYYQDQQIIECKNKNIRVYTLELQKNVIIFEDLNNDGKLSFKLKIDALNQTTFNHYLKLFNIDLIYINQLVTYPEKKMMELIEKSRKDYIFDIHDFFCVCPSYNLLNSGGVYCQAETDTVICQMCINKLQPNKSINIIAWRDHFEQFLQRAKKVIVPSENTKQIIHKYYPNIYVEVKRRKVPNSINYTYNKTFLSTSSSFISLRLCLLNLDLDIYIFSGPILSS